MKHSKSAIRKIAAITLAFAVTFTSLPIMTGDFIASAATVKAPAKVKGFTAKGTSYKSVRLKWKKVTKNTKGYGIYMNGKLVKRVGKNVTTYKVTSLRPNTKYKFRVRAYNKYKYTQYFNIETNRWVKKKPAASCWDGRKRKVTGYKFGKPSAQKTAKTHENPKSPSNPSIKIEEVPSGSEGTSSESQPGTGTNTDGTDQVITTTDFQGVTWTCKKRAGKDYWVTYQGDVQGGSCYDSGLVRYDRTKDGTFTWEGIDYIQISGATFNAKELANPKSYYYGGYMAQVYNADPSKLRVELGSGISIGSVNSFDWDYETRTRSPITNKYIVKNGRRIALAYDKDGNLYKVISRSGGKHLIFCVYAEGDVEDGTGIGIYNGTYQLKVYYDNQYVGAANFNTCSDVIPDTGMTPRRSKYYAVAKMALGAAGSTGSIDGDYQVIKAYLEDRNNVTYGGSLSTEYGTLQSVSCDTVSNIYETWFIYTFGDAGLGFKAGSSNQYISADHSDYYLNSNPDKRYTANVKS